MERKQHYTSAAPPLSRARLDLRNAFAGCFCNGWGGFETLWRILFQSRKDEVQR